MHERLFCVRVFDLHKTAGFVILVLLIPCVHARVCVCVRAQMCVCVCEEVEQLALTASE